MKRLMLYVGLISISVLVTSVMITMGYSPLTNFLLSMAIGAILGFIKGKYFYD